jgi:hypothetical protein
MLADAALLLNVVVRSTSPGYDPEKDFSFVGLWSVDVHREAMMAATRWMLARKLVSVLS